MSDLTIEFRNKLAGARALRRRFHFDRVRRALVVAKADYKTALRDRWPDAYERHEDRINAILKKAGR